MKRIAKLIWCHAGHLLRVGQLGRQRREDMIVAREAYLRARELGLGTEVAV